MNRELVGEPGVSAFLRSVRQNLGGHISRLKPIYTTYLYYDPTQDLEKLKEKLVFFQDLLVDGEARRFGEECVDEWMDDLKALLYDVEDFLDDIKSLSYNQVRVHQLYITSNEKRERLFKILNRTKLLRDRAKGLELKRGRGYAYTGEAKVTMRTRETSSMVDKSMIFRGREKEQADIVKRLLEVDARGKKNYDVVGIWGMGGLGKTTLAQQVFNDPEVVNHFQVKRWVSISDVLDVKRAIKGLIGDSRIGDAESLEDLTQRLKKIVENKRFLFVLDDVWSCTEWATMKTPFDSNQNGSKILVTTRDCNIAHALGDEKPYQLEGLPDEECMLLFEDEAFGNVGVHEEEKKKLMIWGKKIVSACKRVPLAVKIIGSMLHMAKEEKWLAVAEKANLWDTTYAKDEIHPAIRLSYHYLPASLKRCFECMAVFPPDYEFKQDDVVRLWIADGSVEEVEGRRVEDIGNEYYNELKARSLIQENDMMHDIVHHLASLLSRKFCYKEDSTETPASVRHALGVFQNEMQYNFLAEAPCLRTLNAFINMNSLELLPEGISFIERFTRIRYLTIKNSDLKHFPDSLCMLNNLQFLVFKLCHFESLPDTISSLSNLRDLILECCDSISSLPESICTLSKLQVLVLEHCRGLKRLPKDIGDLRSLRTLDLSETSISSLPESICTLSKLQVLGLEHCNGLTCLPKDIGDLRSLRTLDLSKTCISSLPKSICALSQLQVLNLEGCCYLKQLPKDIGYLKSLRELNLIEITLLRLPKSFLNGTGLQVLSFDKDIKLSLFIGSLSRLDELSINRGILSTFGGELQIAIENVEEAERACLKSKKIIRELEFQSSKPGNKAAMEVKIMEALEPHHALKSLTFSNYRGDKFPSWMMSTNICLSNLLELKMEELNNIREMIDMEFVLLRCLSIENCPMLRRVLTATPKLRELTVMKCGELQADSVRLLPSLFDEAGMHSIVSQLTDLECDYNIFEYFLEKLRTANSEWKIKCIMLCAGGRKVASLPRAWPSMMKSLHEMVIEDIGPGKFQFLPDGDQSAFPPSLGFLSINICPIQERLRHHSFIISSDGKVKSEEVSTDPKGVGQCDRESISDWKIESEEESTDPKEVGQSDRESISDRKR